MFELLRMQNEDVEAVQETQLSVEALKKMSLPEQV